MESKLDLRVALKNGAGHSASPNRENLIDQIETEAVAYKRARFGRWSDVDGDCIDTRGELLAKMSTGQVTRSEDGCKVIRGKWSDPYSGRTLTNPEDVDVDHLVPLKWAWDRGASDWSQSKRIEFANDAANLFVVHDQVNREKGAMGPDEWMPPKAEFQCKYITRFMRVVSKYRLSLSPEEKATVEQLRENRCK